MVARCNHTTTLTVCSGSGVTPKRVGCYVYDENVPTMIGGDQDINLRKSATVDVCIKVCKTRGELTVEYRRPYQY